MLPEKCCFKERLSQLEVNNHEVRQAGTGFNWIDITFMWHISLALETIADWYNKNNRCIFHSRDDISKQCPIAATFQKRSLRN